MTPLTRLVPEFLIMGRSFNSFAKAVWLFFGILGFVVFITAAPVWFSRFLLHLRYDVFPFIGDAYHVMPPDCQLPGNARPRMVYFISSRPNGFEMRQSIRETFGRTAESCGVKIVFGFGEHGNSTLQKLIFAENEVHRDIVQTNKVTDGYKNQTLIVLSFFEWAYHYCDTPLIAKGDDDTWVNMKLIMGLIGNIAEKNYVGGLLFPFGSPVLRDPNHKNHILKSDRNTDAYYMYASGVFYVFPSHLNGVMLDMARKMVIHDIDDAFITGDLVELVNLLRLEQNGELLRIQRVQLNWMASYPNFTYQTGCNLVNSAFMHYIDPEKRKKLYELPCLASLKTCN